MGLVAKAFQDIITFSRASSGTYVNSNGYITNSSVLNYLTYSNQPENAAWTKSNSFVQQNLLLYSQEFDNATWSKLSVAAIANTTISPDGTLTADTITVSAGSSAHNLQQAGGGSGAPITLSVYAKAGTHSFIQLSQGSAGGLYANFDVSTGTLGTVGGSATATITAAANGFYRCSMTITPGAVANIRVGFVTSSTAAYTEVWTAAGTETVFLWGAQLVQGSVPGDYRATTSAALPVLYADYNGALRARKLCEDSATSTHIAYQSPTPITANTRYVQSVYAKAGERNWMWMTEANNVTATAYFDLANGVVGTVSGTGSPSATITLIGNGWYRCTLAFTPIAAAANVQVRLANGDNSGTYAGNGSSGIYIADAQLNDGSSALAYYDTTASAYNAPRFDYDPVTLAAKGLLVEESRANLLTYSDSTVANLGASSNVTDAISALNPSFTKSIQFGDNTLARFAYKTATTIAATAYTLSVFVRMDDNSTPVIGTTNTSGDFGLVFEGNLITVASTVTAFGNSTHRVQATVTAAGGAGLNVGVVKYTGQSVKGFRITGFQLEAGAFATSYIPTVASQVTRAADVASVNTLSPWFNSVAGTLYVQGLRAVVNPSSAPVAFEIGDGTNNNRYLIYNPSAGTTSEFFVANGGVTQAQINVASAFQANVVGKAAGAYQVNDFQQASNGTLGTADTSGTLPTVTAAYIGRNGTGTVLWNGWIQRITYYPRRLTNAELQTLTTL